MSRRATDEQVIAARDLARQLERGGAPLEIPVNELLSSFAEGRLTLYAQARMQDAFDAARITATPSLRHAGRGGSVVVSSQDRGPEAVNTEAPRALHGPPTSTGAPSAEPGAAETTRSNAPQKALQGVLARWVLLTAAAAVVGALVVVVLQPERTFDRAWWHVGGFTLEGPTSCQETGWLDEVKVENPNAFTYEPSHSSPNSIDGNRDTAWIQRLRENGTNNWITWGFGSDHRVRLLCIRNGWTKDDDTHRETGQLSGFA